MVKNSGKISLWRGQGFLTFEESVKCEVGEKKKKKLVVMEGHLAGWGTRRSVVSQSKDEAQKE